MKRSAAMTPDNWKMWPWMRDLPTKIWSGRGWVPTADGDMRNLAQLPGGGWGMTPGAGVWEGQGQVPVAGKKRRLEELGDLGISWESRNKSWKVTHRLRPGDGTSKQTHKTFPLGSHRGPGVSEAEASEAALRAAREHRDGLAASGVRWDCSTRPGRSSGVSGVSWDSRLKSWQAKIQSSTGGSKKNLFSKIFKPASDSPEDVERARLQAAQVLAEARRALDEPARRLRQC